MRNVIWVTYALMALVISAISLTYLAWFEDEFAPALALFIGAFSLEALAGAVLIKAYRDL